MVYNTIYKVTNALKIDSVVKLMVMVTGNW